MKIEKKFSQRMAAYTATAGAALVATAANSQAGIIYDDTEVAFSDGAFHQLTMEGSAVDFELWGGDAGMGGTHLSATPENGAKYAFDTFDSYATKFAPDAFIWFLSSFSTHQGRFSDGTFDEEWTAAAPRGYLGFSFELENDSVGGALAGTTVYGWMDLERVTVSSGTLHGWAYDDRGVAIAAGAVPEPSSLALLALGALGVRCIRRFNKA